MLRLLVYSPREERAVTQVMGGMHRVLMQVEEGLVLLGVEDRAGS
jgi:hypothetical protein